MNITESLIIAAIIILTILIIVTPVNNKPKQKLTFEEKKEADLLRACDEALKVNK